MIVHFAVVDFLPPNNLAGRLVGGSAEEEKRKAMQKKLVDEKEAAYARCGGRARGAGCFACMPPRMLFPRNAGACRAAAG